MTQSSTLQTAECDKGMDIFGPLEDSLLEDSRTTLVATDFSSASDRHLWISLQHVTCLRYSVAEEMF
jgi:hypothetical protein